jgi:hypothetical protein
MVVCFSDWDFTTPFTNHFMLQSIYTWFFSGFQRPEVEKDVILSSAQIGACAPRRHGIVMVGKAIVGFGVPEFSDTNTSQLFKVANGLFYLARRFAPANFISYGCGSNLEKLGPTHRGPFSNHMFDPHG